MSQEAGFPPGCGLGQVPSPLWASVSSSVKWVHPFPAACVTTPHKLSGLKQHTLIILHSGGSGVHRVLPRLWLTCQQCSVLPESPEGENPLPAFPAFWRAPAFLGSRPLPPTTASDGLSHAESPTLAPPSPLHREASLRPHWSRPDNPGLSPISAAGSTSHRNSCCPATPESQVRESRAWASSVGLPCLPRGAGAGASVGSLRSHCPQKGENEVVLAAEAKASVPQQPRPPTCPREDRGH